MAIRTVTSEDARIKMRDILDDVHTGTEVIIERYRKPSAVVISYSQWQAWRAAQKKENFAHAHQVIADMKSGKVRSISHEDLLQALIDKQAQADS